MTKARTLADFVSSGSPLADGTISVAEVVGAAPLANPTFTGAVTSPQINLVNPNDSGKVLVLDVDQGDVISVGDLEIYDDRTSGIGYMLRTDTSTQAIGADAVVIMDRTGQKSLANFAYSGDTGTAKLRYWDSNGGYDKLITSLAGISVVGTVTADGLNVGGSATFNEGGANTDFRVESDGNTHALFVDAGQNAVTINGSTVATDGSNNYPLSVRANTAADAIAVVGRTNDDIGELGFYESDGTTQLGNVQARVGSMRHRMLSNGGAMMFECNDSGGNLRTRQALYGSEAVFNDGSLDYDFRVESDGNANMLFVDAGNNRVGVGTNAPETAFNVVGHTRITGPIDSDAASTGYAASGAYATISGLPCYEGIIYQYVARSNLSPTNVAMAMGYAMGRGGNTFTFSNVLTAGRITMSSGANGDITITNSHSGSATCAFRVLRVL